MLIIELLLILLIGATRSLLGLADQSGEIVPTLERPVLSVGSSALLQAA